VNSKEGLFSASALMGLVIAYCQHKEVIKPITKQDLLDAKRYMDEEPAGALPIKDVGRTVTDTLRSFFKKFAKFDFRKECVEVFGGNNQDFFPRRTAPITNVAEIMAPTFYQQQPPNNLAKSIQIANVLAYFRKCARESFKKMEEKNYLGALGIDIFTQKALHQAPDPDKIKSCRWIEEPTQSVPPTRSFISDLFNKPPSNDPITFTGGFKPRLYN
jgi:hypothetical protein